MNSDFERIRKVGVVRNLRQYCGICLKELNKTTICLIRRAALLVEIKNCRLKSSLISLSVCVPLISTSYYLTCLYRIWFECCDITGETNPRLFNFLQFNIVLVAPLTC
jgi:hypothetical protein